MRLLAGGVGVPSVDLERLQLWLRSLGGLADRGHAASEYGSRAEKGPGGGGAEDSRRRSESGHVDGGWISQ